MSEKVYLDFANTIMGKDYVKYIKKETSEKNDQLNEYFRNLRESNRITFADARNVDYEIFGYYGEFWTSAYNYPCEGDFIYRNGEIIGRAQNVGLLTFSIDY